MGKSPELCGEFSLGHWPETKQLKWPGRITLQSAHWAVRVANLNSENREQVNKSMPHMKAALSHFTNVLKAKWHQIISCLCFGAGNLAVWLRIALDSWA